MKFPNLTKIISLVLAALSVSLIFTGIYNIHSAVDDRKEDKKTYDLLVKRADTYEKYSDKLQGADTYATLKEKLDELKEEYGDLNAEHRTELGIFSATEGGIKEGEKTLDSTQTQLSSAESQLTSQESALLDENSTVYQQLKATANEEAAKQLKTDQEAADYTVTTTQSDLTDANAALAEANIKKAEIEARTHTDEEYEAAVAEVEEAEAAAQEAQTAYTNAVSAAAALKLPETETAYQEAAFAIAEAEAFVEVEATRAVLEQYEDALESAKDQLYDTKLSLYGERSDLSDEKLELSAIQSEMEDLEKEANLVKSEEAVLASARIALETNETIKAKVDGGEGLLTAAREVISSFSSQYRWSFALKICTCIMVLLSGIGCILGALCVFGKIPSPKLKIALPFTVFGLCIASEIISLCIGKGNMYSALTAGVFALALGIFLCLPATETAVPASGPAETPAAPEPVKGTEPSLSPLEEKEETKAEMNLDDLDL